MDHATVLAYDDHAVDFADDWLRQPVPDDLYQLLARYFSPGPAADIGCGAGRDVAWLNRHGLETIGYDASSGLLAQARLTYPGLHFEQASLPELSGLDTATFQNVLCETVIMHLAPEQVGPATTRLLELLRPDGTLFLSWRVTEGRSQRDGRQRLYAAFDPALVRDACRGHRILLDEEAVNASSGKTVHRLVVRKNKKPA